MTRLVLALVNAILGRRRPERAWEPHWPDAMTVTFDQHRRPAD